VGIPVREDQLNEDAQADLLIGDDGTARAIRYLMLQGRIPAASMTIGPVVKDKPYSALGVTERFQTLADGNRIVQRTSSMWYRDREGRERRETAGLFPEPIAVISDPVSNDSWILSPQNRTASRRPNAPQPPPAVPGSGSSTGIMVKGRPQDRGVLVGGTVSGSPAEHAGIANGDIVLAINGQAVKNSNDLIQRTVAIPVGRTVALTIIHQGKERTVNLTTRERAATYNASMSLTGEPEAEDLGNQVIQGVTAQGRRTRQPVAAGAIGNERAFEVVNETWFSPDLRVMMMEKHSDPRSGDIVYRLTNVNRRDPDRSLFRVPKDYRVSPQLSPAFLPAAQ
jgi:hypothetical protein